MYYPVNDGSGILRPMCGRSVQRSPQVMRVLAIG